MICPRSEYISPGTVPALVGADFDDSTHRSPRSLERCCSEKNNDLPYVSSGGKIDRQLAKSRRGERLEFTWRPDRMAEAVLADSDIFQARAVMFMLSSTLFCLGTALRETSED